MSEPKIMVGDMNNASLMEAARLLQKAVVGLTGKPCPIEELPPILPAEEADTNEC